MADVRLQKIISNAGKASRRVAEQWIAEGRVAVNGQVVRALGARADPERDEVTVDGVPVETSRYRYFALHKPRGFLTTASDDRGRDTVVDLVPVGDVVLHPVGRLDADTEGLLIMTSDGNLTNLLTHPRHSVEKEYLVAVDAPLSAADEKRAVRGVEADGERLSLSSVRAVLPPETERGAISEKAAWLLVVLRHGRKREIRRLLAALGREVLLLRRIRIGPLALGNLGSGAFRELTPEEVDGLYAAARSPGDADAPRPTAHPEARAGSPPEPAAIPWNVAIDGPAASGKTTVGMTLATRFGYRFLDTGLMYRAFTLAALRAEVPASDPARCATFAKDLDMEVRAGTETRVLIDGVDVTGELRSPEVEGAVSSYSAIPGVRRVLVGIQRAIAREAQAVLVGRDIGTEVLPHAPLKIYLDASEAARADRRRRQFADAGGPDQETRRQALTRRDHLDSSRTTSPLRVAEGAVYIDTTELGLDEVIELVTEEVRCAAG